MSTKASSSTPLVTRKRCAVYTRKSSDEGLDQEYNSLEAQRDAGTAFVLSQRHEGWLVLPECYDDGGYSGGNLDRPALKRLLADIETNKIDIVVVYKIDRLTRNLADFARLVDVFDQHNVSFVAVTQQFSTTTSMGRLTLNILLSFAQFEREVTSERIRDKIAASKAKGLWMGGTPPLGYDVVDRKLIVNETEAALVRDIFRRYAEHGSAAKIVRELEVEGRTTKSWHTQSGRFHAGRSIDQQHIFYMLRNRIYLGEMTFKGKSFPGQHDPIINQALWDAAHAFVMRRKQGERDPTTKYPALLTGLLFAPDGQKMIHQATRKKSGRIYRYYVPYLHKRQAVGATLAPEKTNLGSLPAAEIETAVLTQVHQVLSAPEVAIGAWKACQRHPMGTALDEPLTVIAMKRIAAIWDQLFPAEQQRIMRLLIDRIEVHERGLEIHWREDGWLGLGTEVTQHPLVEESRDLEEEVAP
jgi:site-specific DNA recombinase